MGPPTIEIIDIIEIGPVSIISLISIISTFEIPGIRWVGNHRRQDFNYFNYLVSTTVEIIEMIAIAFFSWIRRKPTISIIEIIEMTPISIISIFWVRQLLK